jgi:exopolysaccharide biosynthesis polyprenyl glycosylphosphotransferase
MRPERPLESRVGADRNLGMTTQSAIARRETEPQWAPTGRLLAQRDVLSKDALRRRMLAAADVSSALLAGAGLGLAEATGGLAAVAWAAALAPVWVLMAKALGLYDRDHVRIRHQTLEELSSLLQWSVLSVAATVVVLEVLPGELVSVRGAIIMWSIAFVAVIVLRTGARTAWRRVVPPEEGLVIGSGQLAESFIRKLTLEPGHHLACPRRFGLRHDGNRPGGADVSNAIDLDGLESIVREYAVERVILAEQEIDEETLRGIISACRALRVKLSVAPPLRPMLGTAVELSHLAELPLIEFRTWDLPRSAVFLKRAFDMAGACVALLLLSPLFVLVAIAIKLDSAGPVLFRQNRAGKDGAPFRILKFRTMVPDAETRLGEVFPLDEFAELVFKLRTDPRITRIGRTLRRTSIDELPQLFNVVRGEMSLVGPRPEEVWVVARYGEADRFKLTMRPGITGPTQVHGRGDLNSQERIAVERDYVENYSLKKDLLILLRTIPVVVRGWGAY